MGKKSSGNGTTLRSFFIWIVQSLVVALFDYWPYLTYISLTFCLWKSKKAIETEPNDRCRQWLKFWLIIIVITFFESSFPQPFEWIPIWDYAKPVLICCLAPLHFEHLKGAIKDVYDKWIRRVFRYRFRERKSTSLNNELKNPWASPAAYDDEHDD